MKAAQRIFLFSAIYGIIVLLPMYFLEAKNNIDFPPAITHPEHYYGFIGVALACQVLFIIISRDPVRYKPVMIAAILEKAAFGLATPVLFLLGRIHPLILFMGMIDLFLMSLFIIAYRKTPRVDKAETGEAVAVRAYTDSLHMDTLDSVNS